MLRLASYRTPFMALETYMMEVDLFSDPDPMEWQAAVAEMDVEEVQPMEFALLSKFDAEMSDVEVRMQVEGAHNSLDVEFPANKFTRQMMQFSARRKSPIRLQKSRLDGEILKYQIQYGTTPQGYISPLPDRYIPVIRKMLSKITSKLPKKVGTINRPKGKKPRRFSVSSRR